MKAYKTFKFYKIPTEKQNIYIFWIKRLWGDFWEKKSINSKKKFSPNYIQTVYVSQFFVSKSSVQ